MATPEDERETVFKGIRIRRDQIKWLEEKHINVSSLVRDLLDAYIAEQDAPRRNGNAHREVAEATA